MSISRREFTKMAGLAALAPTTLLKVPKPATPSCENVSSLRMYCWAATINVIDLHYRHVVMISGYGRQAQVRWDIQHKEMRKLSDGRPEVLYRGIFHAYYFDGAEHGVPWKGDPGIIQYPLETLRKLVELRRRSTLLPGCTSEDRATEHKVYEDLGKNIFRQMGRRDG